MSREHFHPTKVGIISCSTILDFKEGTPCVSLVKHQADNFQVALFLLRNILKYHHVLATNQRNKDDLLIRDKGLLQETFCTKFNC